MVLLIAIVLSLPVFPLMPEKNAVILVPEKVDTKSIGNFEIVGESRAIFKEGRFEGVFSILWELGGSKEIIFTNDPVYKAVFRVYNVNGGVMKVGPDGEPTGEIYLGSGYPLQMIISNATYDVKVCFLYYPPHQTSFWLVIYQYVTSFWK